MKRIILAGMFILIFNSFISLNGQWARSYGGSSMDIPYSICQTNDGGYIVAGRTSSFGTGTTDFWVLKLFSNGDIEWQKIYGVSSFDVAHSIQQTTDGGYIIAGSTGYTSNIWILKLSSEGDIEWQHTYGGSNSDGAGSIQQTTDGGYIVAGGTSSFGAGNGDIWILKLFADGNIEWQKTYGGSDSDSASSVQQTNDGGYIVAGRTSSFGAGNGDIWILKLSPDGDIESQKAYGESGSDSASSIQQTTDGGYLVLSSTWSYEAGEDAIWILKLSSRGAIEWQKTYRGAEYGYQDANSIQQTTDGGYIVAGSHSSFGLIKGRDFWILKLLSNGGIEWQKKYGGVFGDYAHSIQQTDDGGYIVAGETSSFVAGTYQDFWVFKLSSKGELHSYCDLIRNTDVAVTDIDISPEDTNMTPQDTNIEPQETNISPSDTSATVYNFCSGKYILRINASSGGTTDPSPGIHTYDPGTKVSIKAIPISENIFGGWDGDASGLTNPITITMDSHKSIKASFGGEWGDGDREDKISLGGGCFIATAAYGTPLHSYVRILRDFRDKYLMPSKLGRKMVGLYYKYSPSVANFISKHKVLKVVVKISLLPIIAFSYSMLHFGVIISAVMLVFIFVFPILLILFFRNKKKRLEAKDP
jgi:hypothetical protein